MKRLFKLTSVVGALLVVVVGGFAITARPSLAQNVKSPSDVHVVNAATDPVPVSVIGTHSVNVTNTPNVNVANTPNVNVSSLPAVQVGNAAANPIPVSVQNFPAAQQPQTISLFKNCNIPADTFTGPTQVVYTVPAGKRLVIDFVSFMVFTAQGESYLLSIATGPAGDPNTGTPPGGWFGAEYTAVGRQTCAEMTDIVVDAGLEVRLTPRRDQTFSGETFVTTRLSGRLYDAP